MNKELILQRMADIVSETMTHNQTDFTKYDTDAINGADESSFPMIWICAPRHTWLLQLGRFRQSYCEYEIARYQAAQNCDPFEPYLTLCNDEDQLYLITDDVVQIDRQRATEMARNTVQSVIAEYAETHEPMPKRFKVRIKFQNITLSKLKELIRDCQKHDNNSLLECFRNFHRRLQMTQDHCIEISWHEHWNEFGFCEMYEGVAHISGGIVFHGWPETGYQENYSVQLTPSYGWQTHT